MKQEKEEMKEKKKEKKESALSRLFEYAGNYKYLTMASWVLSVLSAWIALVPFYEIWKMMREILSVAPDYGKAENIGRYGWAAVGFALLSMVIYIAALMCSHIAAFRVQANLRKTMMHHIVTLPMGVLDKDGTGKIRKIVNESSAATETYLAHQLPDRAGAIATPVGLAVLLFVFDWRLGLLSLLPVAVAFAVMGAMTGDRMAQKMKEYQNALEEMSGEAVEYVRGIPVVKTFGQSVFSFKRFQSSIEKYQKWTISYTEDLRKPMIGYTAAINGVFAVLIAAAFWFSGGSKDTAFLVNLLFYIIITPIITVTMSKIMYSSENKMIVEDALARMDGILNRSSLPEAKKPEKSEGSAVSMEHVSFRYEGAARDALHDISLNIREGERVAFVGPSGGGKTTLASLVARFFDPSEGEIRIGGVDVRKIPQKELMNQVSFVFQDSRLLKTSILENIRMGKKDATREEVMEALKNAQCEDIIAKLPDGIDTVLGTKGTYVSGGEAQRLALARVMLKNAPIVILDEATAFADPDNEARMRQAFSRLSEGKTVLMIAHRLSSIADADRIFVLEDGSIRESGTQEELLQKGGVYAHMWEEYHKSVQWKVGA